MFQWFHRMVPRPSVHPAEKALLDDPYLQECFRVIAASAAQTPDTMMAWSCTNSATKYGRLGHLQIYHAACKLNQMISEARGRPVILHEIHFVYRNLTDHEIAGVAPNGMETQDGV